MSGERPFFTTVAFFLALITALSAAGVVPAPEPPAGWEGEVAPGFDPSIESVVAKETVDPDRAAELWARWGVEAVPVLLNLLRDSRWAGFRPKLEGLLAQASSPEMRQGVLSRLAEFQQPPEPRAARWHLLRAVSRWPEGLEFVRNRLAALEGLPQYTEELQCELSDVLDILVDTESPDYLNRLADRAIHGPLSARSVYIHAIDQSHKGSALILPLLQRIATEADPDTRAATEPPIERHAQLMRPLDLLESAEPAPFESGKGTGEAVATAKADAAAILDLSGKPLDFSNEQLLRRFAQSQGNKAVGVLTRVAGDTRYDRSVRTEALACLGRIGSRKSVRAFVKLRDRAMKEVGTPRRDPYRHLDNMIESAAFATGELGRLKSSKAPWESPAYATIERDLRTGRMQYAGRDIPMMRRGREWMPIKIAHIMAP